MLVARLSRIAAVVCFLSCICGVSALAGVTGSISGHVTDDAGNPLSSAKVTAISPSQIANVPTDTRGFYAILNLSPDTYSVSASKDGYDSATVAGITVQADQTASANLALHPVAKTLGKVITTATASVVSKTVTGDLYAVNARTISQYQGSAGGAETLYSQNGVVGSLPGVIRSFGSGGGYFGNGSLSFRGGSTDQVGFELEGIPLNRGFDAANGTSFTTNGIGSLEVYTGGEPADAGRSMSGYINEEIRRGSYPGGADFTAATGGPAFNHTIQADVYGGTPDRRFTYYVSTLAQNQGYNFVDRSNLDNTSFALPAGDPGCGAFNAQIWFEGSSSFQKCVGQVLQRPISQGAWQNFVNPYAAIRDTVGNFHYTIEHNGLSDDLQALYLVGGTETPFLYAGPFIDPKLFSEGVGGSLGPNGELLWPSGFPYIGGLNRPYNSAAYGLYTWPSSGGSTGAIPAWYVDGQTTEEAVEKLSYTRSFSSSSFLRVYAYSLFSAWNFDQATNGFLGDSFYQLHDNATGYTATYQNQLSASNLLRVDADYTRDVTLRYNYASNFFPDFFTGNVQCGTLSTGVVGDCDTTNNNVAIIGGPYAYWNDINPVNVDGAIADTLKAGEKWTFDLGLRYDRFLVPLMPLQITGPNGLAEQGQNLYGYCLHGYAYGPNEPCFGYLTALQQANQGSGLFSVAPGAANWTNVSGSQTFDYLSPRFGMTYALSPQSVLRASVGRYVQQPETFGNEYIGAPWFGANATISVLNNFYDPLGFTAVHNLTPQDSTNYDLSFEQDFSQGLSAKLSPYYRVTRGQILSIPVNPLQPTFVSGYNFGAARIYGAEFLLQKNRSGQNGLSGTLAVTFTNSKIRFQRSLGPSYIDVINTQISNYNTQYHTSYPLFDPNGYYSPSETQSPGGTTASYDVPWVINLNLDQAMNGWHLSPAFTYQSGNPYGDPQDFLDSHCPPPPPTDVGPYPGCIPMPSFVPAGTEPLTVGPDPYTKQFDGLGSLKGPSWLTMNLALSRNIGHNTIASFLWTNVFTVVHNQGYAWELPSNLQALSYGDNAFYSFPLGLDSLTGFSNERAYYGDNYYPYSPESLMPARQFTFSLSTKL